MDYANWRNHKGYIVVRVRSGLFGRIRYSVRQGSQLLGAFSDPIRAELFVDECTREGGARKPGT
jgi:hypothetical protein